MKRNRRKRTKNTIRNWRLLVAVPEVAKVSGSVAVRHDRVDTADIGQLAGGDTSEGGITDNPGSAVEERLHLGSEGPDVTGRRLGTTSEAVVTELANDNGKTILGVHGSQEALEGSSGGVVEVNRHEVSLALAVASALCASSEESVQPSLSGGLVRSDSWCAQESTLIVLQGNEVLNPEVGAISGVHGGLGAQLGFVKANGAVDRSV